MAESALHSDLPNTLRKDVIMLESKVEYTAGDAVGSCTRKVIFLDIKMPKISGLEVLRIIKADERTKLIPVVMMTSSNEEQDIIESHQLGVNSYVVKPLGFANFSKTIAELGFYWLAVNNTPRN